MQRRTLFAWIAALPMAPLWKSVGNSDSTPLDEMVAKTIAAMHAEAVARGVSGVAVVSFCEGGPITGWTSRMMVVGRYKDESNEKDKGSNLIGIAYAKAAEMADTHLDSGSQKRPPLTGEFGWKGGAIAKGAKGYVIAAFSGGKDTDDLAVSHAGLAVLKPGVRVGLLEQGALGSWRMRIC